MKVQSYEDYKYIMVDTSYIYLGAKYSYNEILENEDVAFKLRTIMERYIMPNTDGNTTLEQHFLTMEENLALKTYLQLKVKLKISRPVEKRGLFGKVERRYKTENVKPAEYVRLSEEEKRGCIIQEVIFSKLALMSFAV